MSDPVAIVQSADRMSMNRCTGRVVGTIDASRTFESPVQKIRVAGSKTLRRCGRVGGTIVILKSLRLELIGFGRLQEVAQMEVVLEVYGVMKRWT